MKAPNKSLNGSGVDFEFEYKSSESFGDGIEEEAEGNSRKPEKKRRRIVKPNIIAIVKELMGFNGMV